MKAFELASQLDQLFSFYDYVHSFYGKDGIYPENKRTIPQIAEATAEYLEICFRADDPWTWGDGDSLDRERDRDILLDEYNYVYVPETDNIADMSWVNAYA